MQAKQSSEAPLAGVLLRRLRGGTSVADDTGGGQAMGMVTVMTENQYEELEIQSRVKLLIHFFPANLVKICSCWCETMAPDSASLGLPAPEVDR